MCGIAGVIGARDHSPVRSMISALAHRGPDSHGHSQGPGWELGAARLGIMDPYGPGQPIHNESGEVCLVFNGEIYNHRELRAELKSRGHLFATGNDAEVVVHLFEEEGEACVRRLRGMFAFGIVSGRRLFLARDRLGIKPLHIAWVPERQVFVFASEIKAILRCPSVPAAVDMQSLADSLVLGHPVGTATFLEGVESVAAGHALSVTWGPEGISVGTQQPYHAAAGRGEEVGLDEAIDRVEAALRDSVERHLAADVVVALTLSGGIDSTVLALLARDYAKEPLLAFTVGDNAAHPDIRQAAAVAELLGCEHVPVVFGFADFLASVPEMVASEEQPSSLSGMPFHLLARRVSERVRCCLHGEGADELFGGYAEYVDRRGKLMRIARRLPVLEQLGVAPSARAREMIEALSAGSLDHYIETLLDINLQDPLERHHLDLVDKSAMAASVEMRVPYVDDVVVDVVRRLPAHLLVRADIGIRKYLLRHLCLRRFGLGLTDVVLREKLGVPSAGVRLLYRFEQACEEALPDDYLNRHPLGFCFESKHQLLLFELFEEMFVRQRGNLGGVAPIEEFMKERAAAPALRC